jgi:hypothetical protein
MCCDLFPNSMGALHQQAGQASGPVLLNNSSFHIDKPFQIDAASIYILCSASTHCPKLCYASNTDLQTAHDFYHSTSLNTGLLKSIRMGSIA